MAMGNVKERTVQPSLFFSRGILFALFVALVALLLLSVVVQVWVWPAAVERTATFERIDVAICEQECRASVPLCTGVAGNDWSQPDCTNPGIQRIIVQSASENDIGGVTGRPCRLRHKGSFLTVAHLSNARAPTDASIEWIPPARHIGAPTIKSFQLTLR
nr:hypothetical protein [Pseudarthrobacter oxydans]